LRTWLSGPHPVAARARATAAAIDAAREEWQDVVAALIAAGNGAPDRHFLVAAMAAGLSALAAGSG